MAAAAGLLHLFAPNFSEAPLRTSLRGDARGALAATLVSMPQTMAYGLVLGAALGPGWAGTGVMAALFGSAVVGLVGALFGGCPAMLAAPRSGTSLVLAALIAALMHASALDGVADRPSTALAIAGAGVAVAALIQMGLAVLKLGSLARYVPYPVVTGVINGSALLILISQIGPALGIDLPLASFPEHLGEIRPVVLALVAATVALALWLPHLNRRIPAYLVVLALGVLTYNGLGAFGWQAAAGGTLPAATHSLSLGAGALDAVRLLGGSHAGQLWTLLLPAALSIASLASLDTLLCASALDGRTGRRSDGNRELFAQGVGNLLAGLIGVMPGSGGMSRSIALLRGGATTAAATAMAAGLTLLLTLLLRPYLSYLPQASMSGLLIVVGLTSFDLWPVGQVGRLFTEVGHPSRSGRFDLVAAGVVVLVALLVNLPAAVAIGALLSLASFATGMARTPIRRCYRASALTARFSGDIERLQFIARHGDSIAVIEIEGALFFGTVSEVEAKVDSLIAEGVTHIVLDLKRVRDIDTTGAKAVERLSEKLVTAGGLLVVSDVERERRMIRRDRRARRSLGRATRQARSDRRIEIDERNLWSELHFTGAAQKLGEERMLPDLDQAVALCELDLARQLGTRAEHVTRAEPPVLVGLEAAEIAILTGYATRHRYRTGAVLFRQGDPPDSAYMVARGRAEVVVNLLRARQTLRVQTLLPGAVVGEMALIDPKPRSASVVAQAPTICWRLSSDDLARLRLDHPELAFRLAGNVASIFAERLRATNALLVELEA